MPTASTIHAMPTTSAVIVADRAGCIVHWDDGAEALIGHARAHVLGKRREVIVPAEYAAQHAAGFARAMAGGARSPDSPGFHLPVAMPDGSTRVFAALLRVLGTASDEPAGAVVTLQAAAADAVPWSPVVRTVDPPAP